MGKSFASILHLGESPRLSCMVKDTFGDAERLRSKQRASIELSYCTQHNTLVMNWNALELNRTPTAYRIGAPNQARET